MSIIREDFLKAAAEYVKLHPDNRTHDFVESNGKWYHITITPFTPSPLLPSSITNTTVAALAETHIELSTN